MHFWDSLQHCKHSGFNPQGHEEEPHQHDPHWDSCGRLPGHGGVHPLHHPHVSPGTLGEGPRGGGS